MKGYVALTTILVIVPLLLLTGVNSLYSNITSLLVSKMNYDYQILQTNSETCLEESVHKIKKSPSFVGEYTINQDTWNCTVTISNKVSDSNVKILNIVVEDTNGTMITNNKELNISTNPFELSNIE